MAAAALAAARGWAGPAGMASGSVAAVCILLITLFIRREQALRIALLSVTGLVCGALFDPLVGPWFALAPFALHDALMVWLDRDEIQTRHRRH